jgi:hypothetical protein
MNGDRPRPAPDTVSRLEAGASTPPRRLSLAMRASESSEIAGRAVYSMYLTASAGGIRAARYDGETVQSTVAA